MLGPIYPGGKQWKYRILVSVIEIRLPASGYLYREA